MVQIAGVVVTGSKAKVTFSSNDASAALKCRLDGGAFAACASGVEFSGLSEGSHTVVVQATDAHGNVGSDSESFLVDTQAPAVTISGVVVTGSRAKVTFGSDDATAVVKCRLDGGALATCASGVEFSGLSDGSHTVVVQATDAHGNVGSDSESFVVDTQAPDVVISTVSVSGDEATLTFGSDDAAAQFACKLDAGAFAACTSPAEFAGLSDGSHTVTVRGTDARGNAGSKAAQFTVDTQGPAVTVEDLAITGRSAKLTFGSDDAAAELACKLDGATFTACSSPVQFDGLTEGAHAVVIRATDAYGNTGTATEQFVVDTQAPAVTIAGVAVTGSKAEVTFATDDGTAVVKCKLDAGTLAARASPLELSGLADGSHTIAVQATDAHGNVGSATEEFVVDTQAPKVTIAGVAVAGTAATATFSSDDGAAAVECKLDSGAFAACTSPAGFNGLTVGSHTIVVQATDAHGNVGSATQEFAVAAPTGGSGGTPPTGGSPTPPPGTAPDVTAPKVLVMVPHRVRMSKRGIATLQVRCPRSEPACAVTVKVKLGGKRVARTTLTLAGGSTRTFRLRLSKAARRIVAARSPVRAAAIIAAQDAAGNERSTTRRIVLRAPGA